jgi:phage replication-related protein YjqB (UPF0714/DUF867 family)
MKNMLQKSTTKTLANILLSPYIKEYMRIKDKIAVLALHGGFIEQGTEQISRYIEKNSNASIYIISGRAKGQNFNKFHITSSDVNIDESTKLKTIVNSCDSCITIHGHNKTEFPNTIFLAGPDKNLLKILSASLRNKLPACYKVEAENIPEDINCSNKNNIVYKFKKGGVQIELPQSLRIIRNDNLVNHYSSEALFGNSLAVAQAIIQVIKKNS